ncbi:putative malate dehydrogenase 1B [Coturnix japonica]|uniref:putative malate dehydrogenase 1B n=1 Tax=Coturnix japonica TaxID=93934 RepID=UPI0013A5E252|nr:putative malate dehydrogenase 1B [Coturnix japonica]
MTPSRHDTPPPSARTFSASLARATARGEGQTASVCCRATANGALGAARAWPSWCWRQWLQDVCKMNGWEHKWSPIIWRELLDRGGKGLLLGGLNEFLEHAQRYYGITSTIPTEEILDIAKENLQTYVESEKEQEELRSLINPLQIWITSASAPICCQLIPLLASGDVFGMTTEISIHLLDTVQFKECLSDIVMEVEDMAFPLLRGISGHTELDKAFIQADVIIVLDDILPKRDTQTLENCIITVCEICKVYAPLIENNAKSGVRIISTGKTFVNLKAMMIITYGPSIKPENVIAVATSWESAAKAMVARKQNMNPAGKYLCVLRAFGVFSG